MLLCTRTVIDVIVTCVGVPNSKVDMQRVVRTRSILDDYMRLLNVEDLDELKEALDA